MSYECGECEMDWRRGHAESCSFYKRPNAGEMPGHEGYGFHFHRWTKWAIVDHGATLAVKDALGLPIHNPAGQFVKGHYETQRRHCLICHKSELRETQS